MAVVSKSDFAALCGVSKPLVSRWVREGVLNEALRGTGRHAQIDADAGQQLLRDRLDANQRAGRNAKAKLHEPGEGLSIDAQIKIQKLRLATAQAEKAEAEKTATVDAYVTRKQAVDELFKLRDHFRSMLQVIASEIASEGLRRISRRTEAGPRPQIVGFLRGSMGRVEARPVIHCSSTPVNR